MLYKMNQRRKRAVSRMKYGKKQFGAKYGKGKDGTLVKTVNLTEYGYGRKNPKPKVQIWTKGWFGGYKLCRTTKRKNAASMWLNHSAGELYDMMCC